MIPREITGPQAQFEQSSAAAFRDVRPTSRRILDELRGQTSSLVLTGMAVGTWFEPATMTVVVPVACLFASWVLTRRVILPLRLPRSARRKDYNHPDPATRKPRMAAGSIYLGRNATTGQELWISNEDGRQHAAIPGTTGSGKTTAILSLLANALTHNSGFLLVDGKADNRLYGEVLALARRFGREDDVQVLNFMTASGLKESNSFNPFATGNADSIRELLASQLGDQTSSDANGVFRDRAVGLIGTLTPVLVYMRDEMGLPINIQRIRFSLELRSIWMVAVKKIFLSRDSENGEVSEIPVPKMPEDILYPLQAYLGELPGYDSTVPYNKQSGDMPSQQHGFALMYFTGIFQQLSTSLGHIFKVETSDIDMRDVVLNRRIVVVNLPALENSDATLASLGRIVVASLRAMMAQMLGARLEGDAAEIFSLKPGSGDWPFHIAFDEIGYYATSGMDRMYAMGRGLNMMFWSAFQEVSGVWAKLGEKTQSLLGNANLTIAMRQQDANRTREWLEKTAGQTYVTQATSYTGGSVGQYRESQSAELRQVSRIDWADLQRLIEGEAIILFGGRRVYAKLFHAKVDTSGPTRLNRSLMLAAPQRTDLEETSRIIDFIAEALRSGGLCYSIGSSIPTDADAMATAFSAGIADGLDLMSCARNAVEAVLSAPKQSSSVVAAAATEPPVTDLLPMLQASVYFDNRDSDLTPLSGAPIRIAKDRLDMISAIETASGRPATEARRNAIDIEKLIAANGTPECRSKNETMTSVPLQ